MVGVILCSKARFFSAASTLSMSAISRSAARVSCTLRQVSSTSEEVMPWCTKRASGPTISARWVRKAMTSCLVSRSISSIRATSKMASPGLGPDGLGGFLRDYAEFRQRVRRMRLDLEPDLEARLRPPRWRPFPGGYSGGSSRAPKQRRRGARGDFRPNRFFTPRFNRSRRRETTRKGGGVENLADGPQPSRRRPRLQVGQPALDRKADKLRVGSHAGLGLDEIVIVLNGLHAEIEVCGDLLLGRAGSQLPQDFDLPLSQLIERSIATGPGFPSASTWAMSSLIARSPRATARIAWISAAGSLPLVT